MIDYHSMKKKKELTVHDKAVKLAEGLFVEIDGHIVAARIAPDDLLPCDICQMDCICHAEMAEVCEEVDHIKQMDTYLVLFENLKRQ